MIADLCIKHDVLCISDEVYEWLTYDGNQHVKMGETRPGFSRTHSKGESRIVFMALMYRQPAFPGCGSEPSPSAAPERPSAPPAGR